MSKKNEEILSANTIGRVEGELGCICPHCNRAVFLDETRISSVREEQFQHTGIINFNTWQRCGGWFEVTANALFDNALFSMSGA